MSAKDMKSEAFRYF